MNGDKQIPKEAMMAGRQKLDRAALEARLANGEKGFVSIDFSDIDLSGIESLGDTAFGECDLRHVTFSSPERPTNLRGASFIDVDLAVQDYTFIENANAEGARFESTREGEPLRLHTVFFSGSDLRGTTWTNVDFGDTQDYGAILDEADLSNATIERSNLAGTNLTKVASLHRVQIIDPISIRGMRIRKDQLDDVLAGLETSVEAEKAELAAIKQEVAGAKEIDQIAVANKKLGIIVEI